MIQNLITLLPLITILVLFVIIITVIRSKSSNNQNSSAYQANKGYKVLCRSQSNRAIAGVCGGIIILAIVIPNSDSPLL